MLMDAYGRLKDASQVSDLDRRQALERIIKLYESWDRPDEAAQWRAKLPTTRPAIAGTPLSSIPLSSIDPPGAETDLCVYLNGFPGFTWTPWKSWSRVAVDGLFGSSVSSGPDRKSSHAASDPAIASAAASLRYRGLRMCETLLSQRVRLTEIIHWRSCGLLK